MAKEIKTVKVSTAMEEQTIYAYQVFGWKLLNNQEIYSKDSHLHNGWSVTETVHYVKLTFEREAANTKQFYEIKRLENAYHQVAGPGKKPSVLGLAEALAVFSCEIPVLIIALLFSFKDLFLIIVGTIVVLTFIRKIQQKRLATWEAACRKVNEKKRNILREAEMFWNI